MEKQKEVLGTVKVQQFVFILRRFEKAGVVLPGAYVVPFSENWTHRNIHLIIKKVWDELYFGSASL